MYFSHTMKSNNSKLNAELCSYYSKSNKFNLPLVFPWFNRLKVGEMSLILDGHYSLRIKFPHLIRQLKAGTGWIKECFPCDLMTFFSLLTSVDRFSSLWADGYFHSGSHNIDFVPFVEETKNWWGSFTVFRQSFLKGWFLKDKKISPYNRRKLFQIHF